MLAECVRKSSVIALLLCFVQICYSRVLLDEGNGVVVPLFMRQGVRARGLLRGGSLPVLGSVREVGYFYAYISVGTPPRSFAVIIDTGSTITYVPCSNCKHCGKHQSEAFDLATSSTAVSVGCEHASCKCGSPACSCQQNKCYYFRSYAEKSTSEGWLVTDQYIFPDNKGSCPLVFGCENGESGEIFRQKADGILGMGNNDIAFQSQLVKGGVMEDVFALCFAWPAGGAMTLGDVPIPPNVNMVYTPLIDLPGHKHYYNVKLDAITVNGRALPINRVAFDVGYGTVIDSGTTFTYIPTEAFQPLLASINEAATKAGLKRAQGMDRKYKDVCWEGGPSSFEALGDDIFPTVDFVFDQGTRMSMPPYRYLFLLKNSTFCLGIFDNGRQGILLGGVSVRNLLVQYDRRNNRIGWGETDCGSLLKQYRRKGY